MKDLEEIASNSEVSNSDVREAMAEAFKKSRCLIKGGLGVIYNRYYIQIKSETNSILINGKEWRGLAKSEKEIVFIFKDVVLKSDALPLDFELSKSILVSFEGRRISFFDFNTFRCGNYFREMDSATSSNNKETP